MNYKLLILILVFWNTVNALDNKPLDDAITRVQNAMASKDFKEFTSVWDPDSASARALAKTNGKGWGDWDADMTLSLVNREELYSDRTISIARVLAKEKFTKIGNSEILLGENITPRILIFKINLGNYRLFEMTAYDISPALK